MDFKYFATVKEPSKGVKQVDFRIAGTQGVEGSKKSVLEAMQRKINSLKQAAQSGEAKPLSAG